MIKYNLRTINRNPDLHKHEFVIYEDVAEAMQLQVKCAIDAGADESKLMEFFDVEKT